MDVAVVFEERYWYPEDGGVVWLAGYTVVDPDTGEYLARDAPALHARGLRVAGVAGAGRHHAAALASDAAAPGSGPVLRLDGGEAWSAVALRESRPSPRDPRTGVTMLLAAAPAVTLAVRS